MAPFSYSILAKPIPSPQHAASASTRLSELLEYDATMDALATFTVEFTHTLEMTHDSARMINDDDNNSNNKHVSGDGDTVGNAAVGGEDGRLLDSVVRPLWGTVTTTGGPMNEDVLAPAPLANPFGLVVRWLIPQRIRGLARISTNLARNGLAVVHSPEYSALSKATGRAVELLGMSVTCPEARKFFSESALCASHVAKVLNTPETKACIRQGAVAVGSGLNWAASRHCKRVSQVRFVGSDQSVGMTCR